MSKVIDYFMQICKIPHASYETDELRAWLLKECENRGFKALADEAGNIYAYKGEPKICLQAHYDMVKVGSESAVLPIIESGFMSAKNSSLGADNGIGVAIILAMMDEFSDLEVVFTNNEEVGLWGAARFNFEIKSKKLLNLDSEEDFRVSIGCAGSVDMYASCKLSKLAYKGFCYELAVENLPGGHSGTQIDQNIPNAIKILARFVRENSGKIVFFKGGERRNSIAANAKCVAVFESEISSTKFSECEFLSTAKFLGQKDCEIQAQSAEILDILTIFSQGVKSWNKDLKIPEDSINLSTAKEKNGEFEILFFARSMSKTGLENSKFETKVLCERLGFELKCENQTTPWKPEINEFSNLVLNSLKKFSPNAHFAAVHAGLECGVFIGFDEKILATSIGPNIFNPHSTAEKVELKSVELIEKAVREIISKL